MFPPLPRPQQTVGKYGHVRDRQHLDFVNGQEFDFSVQRHGFNGTDEIVGPGRDDFLFAGDQRTRAVPFFATTRS